MGHAAWTWYPRAGAAPGTRLGAPLEADAWIRAVFPDAFGRPCGADPWVERSLARVDLLGLLDAGGDRPSGYAMFSVVETSRDDGPVLWNDAIAIRRAAQGGGWARRAIEEARARLQAGRRAFGWIGGRTQNAAVHRVYASFGRPVFPIDEPYTTDLGRALLASVAHAPQLHGPARSTFDAEFGVVRRAYAGRLGDHPVADPSVDPFERHCRVARLDRDAGDAVILLGRLSGGGVRADRHL